MSPSSSGTTEPRSDFEAVIRILSTDEGGRKTVAFNGIRWDLWYAGDELSDGLWCIWPRFLEADGTPMQTEAPLPIGIELCARMYIASDGLRPFHSRRLTVGTRFWCCEGAKKVAEGRVVRISEELRTCSPALILTGPTASGKTAVSLLVAEKLGAEILAMDSATVYRGMDIGTAKPSAAERARVPHHLLDIADPSATFSVADWLRAAQAAELDILKRGKKALFSGGTPLYLKALLEGLFEGAPQSPELRREIEALPDLHAELARVDPVSAKRLHPNDRKRLVRAIEVFRQTGKTISELQTQWGVEPRPARIVLLDPPRDVLRERIGKRAKAMLAAGLVEEAARLEMGAESRKFIGYTEALELKAGRMTRDAAVQQMAARTWVLVRRQATWFRKLKEPLRIESGSVEAMAAQAAEFFARG